MRGKELAGGRHIPILGDQHVDNLAELVDRSVQINPLPGDLDVGLVHELAITRAASAGSCRVDQQWGEALHPAVDGDVVNGDAAFGEQFFDVAVGL